jgi:hypothetical protein
MKKLQIRRSKLGNLYHCWVNFKEIKEGDICGIDGFLGKSYEKYTYVPMDPDEEYLYDILSYSEFIDEIALRYKQYERDDKINKII